jgi:hypothetical protein
MQLHFSHGRLHHYFPRDMLEKYHKIFKKIDGQDFSKIPLSLSLSLSKKISN